MSNQQEINDFLVDVWRRVEQRVGRSIDCDVAPDGRGVVIKEFGKSVRLPEDTLDNYLEAPSEKERDAREDDIFKSMLREVKVILAVKK